MIKTITEWFGWVLIIFGFMYVFSHILYVLFRGVL